MVKAAQGFLILIGDAMRSGSGFKRYTKPQELLSKEDIELLTTAVKFAYTQLGDTQYASSDVTKFLLAKLQRMKS